MSQLSYMLPVGVCVIKITHRDVSCHGEQSDHICKKYSDQMNFNEVYTRGGYGCRSAGDSRWRRACPLIWQYVNVHKLFFFFFFTLMEKQKKSQSRGVVSVQIVLLF